MAIGGNQPITGGKAAPDAASDDSASSCSDRDPGRNPSAGCDRSLAGRLRRWGAVALLLALMAGGYALGWHRYFTMSSLIMNREALHGFVEAQYLLALSGYIVVYIALVALSFPGASLMTVAGGLLFGWFAGGTATAFAATAGATAVFLIARTSLGASLQERAGPFMNRLSGGFRADAFNYLLFLRLTPVFPFWLVNIAPAIFHVRLRTYVAATLIGILPGTYAFSFIGTGLDSIIAAQERADPGCAQAGTCSVDLAALVTPELLIALAALGLVSLLPVALRKWRARRGQPTCETSLSERSSG